MTFQEQLDEVIRTWNEPQLSDEWAFARLREETASSMPSHEAYAQIAPTVEKLLSCQQGSTATEIVETLLTLARTSNTTEIPSAVSENRAALRKKMASCDSYAQDKFSEWLSHYRL